MSKSLVISKMIDQLNAKFQLVNVVGNALLLVTLICLCVMIFKLVDHQSWWEWLLGGLVTFGIVIAMCVNIITTGNSITTTIQHNYSADATLKLVNDNHHTYVFSSKQIKDKTGNYQYIGSLNHEHEWSQNADGNKLYLTAKQVKSAKTVNARTYLTQVVNQTERTDD